MLSILKPVATDPVNSLSQSRMWHNI